MEEKKLKWNFRESLDASKKHPVGSISLLKNTQGVSLVELIIAVGVSGALLGLSSTMYFKLSELSRKAQVISAISQMSHQYINLLSSDATLKNTLNKLTNTTPPYTYVTRSPFACLFSAQATACTGPTWTAGQNDHILQIYDNSRPETGSTPQKLEPKILTTSSTSDTPLTASQQTNGFNYSGQMCSGFNSGSGSDGCPFQVQASWTPICPEGAATCTRPKMKIRVKFVYRPLHIDDSIAQINLDKYEISLEKEPIGPNVLMANSEQSLVFYYQDNCPDIISPIGTAYCYQAPYSFNSNPTPPTYTHYATGLSTNRGANEYVTERPWVQNINVGTKSIAHVQVNVRTLYNQWDITGNPLSAYSNYGDGNSLLDSSLPSMPSTYEANSMILIDGVLCASGHTQFVDDARFVSAKATCIQNLDSGNHQIVIIGQSIVVAKVPQPNVNYVPWIQVGTVSIAIYK